MKGGAAAGGPKVIIIKKKAKGHGGGHGGAWKVAYADEPSAVEVDRAAAFLTQQTAALAGQKMADPGLAALTNYCQALLSSNRFLYVD